MVYTIFRKDDGVGVSLLLNLSSFTEEPSLSPPSLEIFSLFFGSSGFIIEKISPMLASVGVRLELKICYDYK